MSRGYAAAIGVALVVVVGCSAATAAAQTTEYEKMAPIAQYMMEKNAEVQLARSAAPRSISGDATILVLGRNGYETAVKGKNGFVCWVSRSWMAAFDWPEFWNPKIRAADCMNPQSARAVVPVALLRSRMMMAGRSRAEVLTAVKQGYANGTLPKLEGGAMDYMMSKSAYLTDQGEHNGAHVMFLTTGVDAKDWGSNMEGSPVMSAPYWFFASTDATQMQGLPPIVVFLVGTANWSDGTRSGK